jgi:ribosomal-protein-alanine N-acetyltransferase
MKTMTEILPASLRDLLPLRTLEQACFPKDAWPLLDLIAVLTWPEMIRLKAVESGQMVGFVGGESHRSESLAWIATLGVLPGYQRRGIGRALLRECEARLTEARVCLCVRITNSAAIELYRQEGYQVMDTWQKYYFDGENALVMEKSRT